MAKESAPLDRKARRRAERALARTLRGRGTFGRAGLWMTVVLLPPLYTVMMILVVMEPGLVGRWSLVSMAIVPAWASLVVLVSSALTVPLERGTGTLGALRLTPLPVHTWARAGMHTRFRAGMLALLAALPLYLVPHGAETIYIRVADVAGLHDLMIFGSREGNQLCIHVGLLSTYWRLVFAHVGFIEIMRWVADVEALVTMPSLASVLGAFVLDATRLYAFAAIGTAVSVRARSGVRAVSLALVLGAVFLFLTLVVEWIGGRALILPYYKPYGYEWGAVPLVVAAFVGEAGLGNLLAPKLLLRLACRGAEKRLEP